MRFLMFIKHAETSRPVQPPKALMDAMGGFVGEGFQKGWLKETGGFERLVREPAHPLRGGKLTMTDGPFAETKEIVAATPSSRRRRKTKLATSRGGSWSCTRSTGPSSSARD